MENESKSDKEHDALGHHDIFPPLSETVWLNQNDFEHAEAFYHSRTLTKKAENKEMMSQYPGALMSESIWFSQTRYEEMEAGYHMNNAASLAQSKQTHRGVAQSNKKHDLLQEVNCQTDIVNALSIKTNSQKKEAKRQKNATAAQPIKKKKKNEVHTPEQQLEKVMSDLQSKHSSMKKHVNEIRQKRIKDVCDYITALSDAAQITATRISTQLNEFDGHIESMQGVLDSLEMVVKAARAKGETETSKESIKSLCSLMNTIRNESSWFVEKAGNMKIDSFLKTAPSIINKLHMLNLVENVQKQPKNKYEKLKTNLKKMERKVTLIKDPKLNKVQLKVNEMQANTDTDGRKDSMKQSCVQNKDTSPANDSESLDGSLGDECYSDFIVNDKNSNICQGFVVSAMSADKSTDVKSKAATLINKPTRLNRNNSNKGQTSPNKNKSSVTKESDKESADQEDSSKADNATNANSDKEKKTKRKRKKNVAQEDKLIHAQGKETKICNQVNNKANMGEQTKKKSSQGKRTQSGQGKNVRFSSQSEVLSQEFSNMRSEVNSGMEGSSLYRQQVGAPSLNLDHFGKGTASPIQPLNMTDSLDQSEQTVVDYNYFRCQLTEMSQMIKHMLCVSGPTLPLQEMLVEAEMLIHTMPNGLKADQFRHRYLLLKMAFNHHLAEHNKIDKAAGSSLPSGTSKKSASTFVGTSKKSASTFVSPKISMQKEDKIRLTKFPVKEELAMQDQAKVIRPMKWSTFPNLTTSVYKITTINPSCLSDRHRAGISSLVVLKSCNTLVLVDIINSCLKFYAIDKLEKNQGAKFVKSFEIPQPYYMTTFGNDQIAVSCGDRMICVFKIFSKGHFEFQYDIKCSYQYYGLGGIKEDVIAGAFYEGNQVHLLRLCRGYLHHMAAFKSDFQGPELLSVIPEVGNIVFLERVPHKSVHLSCMNMEGRKLFSVSLGGNESDVWNLACIQSKIMCCNKQTNLISMYSELGTKLVTLSVPHQLVQMPFAIGFSNHGPMFVANDAEWEEDNNHYVTTEINVFGFHYVSRAS